MGRQTEKLPKSNCCRSHTAAVAQCRVLSCSVLHRVPHAHTLRYLESGSGRGEGMEGEGEGEGGVRRGNGRGKDGGGGVRGFTRGGGLRLASD